MTRGDDMAVTQCEKILQHLEQFGSITAMEAVNEYGIMRLASRITDLKKQGVPINRDIVSGKNRFGENIYFAKYTLREELINE